MKLRRVFSLLILCPFAATFTLGQPQFTKSEPEPYTVGMNVLKQYGAKAALSYFEDCHSETGDDTCFYGLGYILYVQGRNEESLEMVDYLLAKENLSDKFLGDCWALVGSNMIFLRRFTESEKPLLKAVSYYQKAGHKRNEFKATVQLANGKLQSGDLRGADHFFEKAAYLAITHNVNKGNLYSLRGFCAYLQGEQNAAENFAERAYREFEKASYRKNMIETKASLSFFKYQNGDIEGAITTIEQALELCRVYKVQISTWTALVDAYIHKCEQPDQLKNLLERKLQNEKSAFLKRFYSLALEKKCP